MVRPDTLSLWDRWVDLLDLRRKLDSRRDELGNPYTFDCYDFQQIDRGESLLKTGGLDEAARDFLLAHEWCSKSRAPDARFVQYEALIHLADVYRKQSQTDDASEAYLEAIKLLQSLQSQHDLGVGLFRYATLCEENERFEEAREHYCQIRTLWMSLEQENGHRGNWNRLRRYANERKQLETQIDEILNLATIDIPRPMLIPTRQFEFEIEAIPIVETQLAAGAGVWTAGDAISDYIHFDSMLIRDVRYALTNLLDGSHRLCLLRDYDHLAARIVGNSMDKAGIDDGDFVILRLPRGVPFVPNNMDIVAAILPDVADRKGILKRFRSERGKIMLVSESSHPNLPDHKTREYFISAEAQSAPVEFRGQAIAVLKPF